MAVHTEEGLGIGPAVVQEEGLGIGPAVVQKEGLGIGPAVVQEEGLGIGQRTDPALHMDQSSYFAVEQLSFDFSVPTVHYTVDVWGVEDTEVI